MTSKYNDILSICITVKNRSRVEWGELETPLTLFPDCIDSIGNLFSIRDKVEIVVADWNSTDWPIREWLPAKCKNVFKIIPIDHDGFSKGYGANIAVDNAMGDTIFLMDADMLLKSRSIVETGMNAVRRGGVYFPIPKYIINQKGEYRYNCGVGNVFISKKMFYDVGKLPEYWRYGFEDSDFYKILEQRNIPILAGPTNDLIHPFHPQSLEFKEQYIDDDPDHDKQIEERVDVYRRMKENNEDFRI